MANVKTARDALEKSVTTFMFCKSYLSKTLNSTDAVSERTLNNKMKKLEDAIHDLNMTHTTWLGKAELNEEQLWEDKYSSTWLETQWDDFGDLQDKAEDKLSVYSAETLPPIQSNKQKLQIYNKQMETLQVEINTTIDNLSKRLSCEIVPGSHKVYVEML